MPKDLESMRHAFRKQVDRRRRYELGIFLPLVVFILCVIVAAFVRPDFPWNVILVAAAILCWLMIAAIGIAMPGLECSNCWQKLDRAVHTFCPECGSSNLEAGGWLQSTRCNSCRKRLAVRRGGRSWKIRACTYCGVVLDERGV